MLHNKPTTIAMS